MIAKFTLSSSGLPSDAELKLLNPWKDQIPSEIFTETFTPPKTDGSGNITSTFNIPTPSSNRKLEKIVDILGRETKPQQNTPFLEIYDDGSTEKKIVIE